MSNAAELEAEDASGEGGEIYQQRFSTYGNEIERPRKEKADRTKRCIAQPSGHPFSLALGNLYVLLQCHAFTTGPLQAVQPDAPE